MTNRFEKRNTRVNERIYQRASDIKELFAEAGAAARKALGVPDGKGGYSITCGEGYDGWAWYAYWTKHPELGSIKLEDVTPFDADRPMEQRRTSLAPALDPKKRMERT